MCADNLPARRSLRPGPRHRAGSGEHRPSRGATWLVSIRPDGRAVFPSARSTDYVGRVGALAVALGVGAAIAGLGGVAAADTGTGTRDGSGGGASRSGDSEPTTRTPRGGDRRKTPGDRAAADPAPAQAVEVPAGAVTAADPGRRAVDSARRSSTGLRSGAPVTLPPGPDAGSSSRLNTPPAVDRSSPLGPLGSLLTQEGLTGFLQQSVASVIGDLLFAATGSGVAPEAAPAPDLTAPPQSTAPAVDGAPSMTAAAPAAALSDTDAGLLEALGGANGGGPAAATLAWAAAAVARRDELTGASPEVAPAAAEDTGEPVDPTADAADGNLTATGTITSFDPGSGFAGQTVTINGTDFPKKGSIIAGQISSIEFGGVKTTDFTSSPTQITVKVPSNAKTGKITLVRVGGPAYPNITSSTDFTVNTPSNITLSPRSGLVGSTVTITGSNFTALPGTGSISVQFCGSQSNCTKNGVAAPSITVNSDTEITATVPDGAATGPVQVTTPSGTGQSADSFTVTYNGQTYPDPPPGCDKGVCKQLIEITVGVPPLATTYQIRPIVVNQLAKTIEAALPTSGPATTCDKNGCPYPPGETTLPVANTIAMYAFNVIDALAGSLPNDVVGQTVVDLVTQPDVLTFVSATVASQLTLIGAPIAAVPDDVANTVGNTVATFVQESFGNLEVATALAPFLKTLGVPTTDGQVLDLATNYLLAGKSINDYLLAKFDTTAGAAALTALFSDATVQQDLEAAVTDAIEVLLGQATPTWAGAPQVPSTAVSSYLGQTAADLVLGPDNPGSAALAATIGTAAQGLFASIGDIVATEAGNALGTLINTPGANVPTTLADFAVNTLFGFLRGADKETPPLPFPNLPPLGEALANPAGAAVAGLVNALFDAQNAGPVTAGLSSFVAQVIPGVLGNVGIQALIDEQIASEVTKVLPGPLGTAVSEQVAAAVNALLNQPVVTGALTALVNGVVIGVLDAPNVVPALAGAAGLLTAAALTGTLPDALPKVTKALQENASIQQGVQGAVTTSVAQLLSNTGVWQAVDASLVDLLSGVLANQDVQAAVLTFFEDSPLGPSIGANVGKAVVALMKSPQIGQLLTEVVDTMTTDFFGTPGVVTALADAAGVLAAAAVAGNLDTVLPEVQRQLRSDPAIDEGIQRAVGDAVTDLIRSSALIEVLDAAAVALVNGLIEDPEVQKEISGQVAADVSTLLGGGDLGALVGAQAGAAVLNLLTNPVVSDALIGVVDTLIGDFLGYPGVDAAFGDAAGELALAIVTTPPGEGFNWELALQSAEKEFRENPAVQAAAQTTVAAAVTELLDDSALWQAVDGQISTLIEEILADEPIQAAANAAVATRVSALLGGGDLGDLVGAQVGDAVVALMGNPVLSQALVGLVDTVTTDFFGTPGVVAALSNAAGELAAAAVAGTLAEVSPVVQEQLRTDPAIDAGIQRAVGDAVTDLLTDTALWQAVDGQIAILIEEILTDQPVQAAVYDQVAAEVATQLGGGDLGKTVGAQVGDAAVALMNDPAVAQALIGVVDTFFGDFFTYPGVIPAFADAAEGLALGVVTTPLGEGFNWELALASAEAELRANTAILRGVQSTVTATVTELLDDTALWQAVDGQFVTLVDEILADEPVQAAVAAAVAAQVYTLIGGGDLGEVFGAQVGDAVVALMQSPVISEGLIGLVDTVTSDFFGTAGVVAALSNAAGQLAAAAVEGTLAEVGPLVQQALRDSPPVETGVQRAVGDAVTELLTDTTLWEAVDGQIAILIEEFLADPPAQAAVFSLVYDTVYKQLNGTTLAQELAGQAGDAAVALMNDPAVGQALIGVVDTLFGDFFGTPGVIPSFSIVAQELALQVLTTPPWEPFDWKKALASAASQLQNNPYIIEGVDLAAYETVAELLNDTALWQAVDGQVATLITEVLADQPVEAAVGDEVAAQVSALLGGGEIGDLVGAQVGDTVENLMRDPVVSATLIGLVDTVFGDFFGTSGVTRALSNAAGELAVAALQGTLAEVSPLVQEQLRTNPAVDTGVERAVGDVVTELLTDSTLWEAVDSEFSSLVTGLLADQPLQDAVAAEVASQVSDFLGGGDLGTVVGTQVGDAVVSLMRDPEVGNALVGAVNTLFGDFFGAPGVVPTFAIIADGLALGALTTPPWEGFNWELALAAAESALRESPNVQVGVDLAVYEAVTKLLDDSVLWQDVGTTLGTLTSDLIESTVVQQAIGGAVATTVAQTIGGDLGPVVGAAVGDAVQQFLAIPSIGPDLGEIVGAVLPDFFGKPGVDTALAEAAGVLATAVVAGTVPTVLPEVEQRLWAQVKPGLEATIADGLNLLDTDVLSDPAVQQAAGTITTTLIEQLAGDPVVRNAIEEQLGSNVGPAVAELLADTTVVDNIATALGSAVTEILGYPGFTTTLTNTINQFADEVLDGTEVSEALRNAVAALDASPDYRGAIGVAVPGAVGEILGNADDRTAFGEAARMIVVAELGIRNRFIQNIVGQVTEGTVVAFLADRDSWPVISDLVIDALTGTPASELPTVAVDLVLDDPQMPRVLGFAIGAGIGSLFGQNIIGGFIGGVVGVGATVVLGLSFGIINIFRALTGRDNAVPGAAATVVSTSAGDGFLDRVPAPGDLFAMKAVVEDWSDVEALREGVTGGGGFVLTKLDVTEVDHVDHVDQFLDITMQLGGGEQQRSQEPTRGPRLVARFRVDGIAPLRA